MTFTDPSRSRVLTNRRASQVRRGIGAPATAAETRQVAALKARNAAMLRTSGVGAAILRAPVVRLAVEVERRQARGESAPRLWAPRERRPRASRRSRRARAPGRPPSGSDDDDLADGLRAAAGTAGRTPGRGLSCPLDAAYAAEAARA